MAASAVVMKDRFPHGEDADRTPSPASISPREEQSEAELHGDVIRGSISPSTFPSASVQICTKVGRRKSQEDRLCVVPRVYQRDAVGFYGVFDGTVGHHASEFVHRHLLRATVHNEHFITAVRTAEAAKTYLSAEVAGHLKRAMEEGYRVTDSALLADCRARGGHDYASSTSVTALVAGNVLTVGHLGDSRIALGRVAQGRLIGQFLTRDHKPDDLKELRRIEQSGGSLTFLHGGKPFLRGGDFTMRQRRGDRPMQLNYSRAFGGKDLKPYGLSSQPDITQIQLTRNDLIIILASDGLWDVVNANVAVHHAAEARRAGRDAARVLTDLALALHDRRGTIDNCTVVVVFLNHESGLVA